MKILRHRLATDDREALPLVRSPNVGGALDPKYLVIHFTAGHSAESSVNWLTNRDARASAHVVIGRDGEITQLVPFDRVAWHAGASRWDGLEGLNRHSIGIELDNAGRLERKGGEWSAWFGRSYPEDQVMVATHKQHSESCGWHVYTEEQLAATVELSEALVRKYALRDVIGHEDISPGRKTDPGPAFPLESLRARLFGRAEDRLPSYETAVALNIRSGPGTDRERLPGSPLERGTRVEVVRTSGDWRLVNVLDPGEGGPEVQGWVHGDYLHRVD